MSRIKAISLFSCIGVAEYYLKEIGVDILLANDIDINRCKVYEYFYPDAKVVCGDITLDDTKEKILSCIKEEKIDLVVATPPCQGMSSVGKNRSDKDLDHDNRNSLIMESFKIIDEINPSYILFENVPRLLKVRYLKNDKKISILDILEEHYGKSYDIKVGLFDAADYEVPQTRERVFIRVFKKGLKWNDPIPCERQISVSEAIGDLPSLEAGEFSEIKNHWARSHPASQIEWMRHTPSGNSAFDNGHYFPVRKDGERIKGFKNCYKRIEWDKPAPTITMRNEIISSQNNVHPGRLRDDGSWSDARVLTMRELLILMSLPPDIDLPTFISNTSLRQFIGEGIPSKMMKSVVETLVR